MAYAVNPYLPPWEYIPDGEPRQFGDRIYVYGSHDRFNAPIFCVEDYVCWSAPVEDLSDWRCEGVIYRKNQDPKNPLGLRLLFAPDVVQGTDGQYYLYYAFDFLGLMGVAVCDTPAGQYEFLGHVRHGDGTLWGRRKGDHFPFDPGVLVDDDGRVWMYSGFSNPVSPITTGGVALRTDGGVVAELASDMCTLLAEPKLIFPKSGEGSYPEHEFFEASSIRKEKDQYLFVYSSRHNHELCYAYSHRPDGDFQFGGTLVSLGDLFLNGRGEERDGVNYLGNTHGGLLHLQEKWYIFYHRQTNRHSFSRQACAEELTRTPEGAFLQAEVTSCGLNGGPMPGEGIYDARIACNLWSEEGVGRYDGLLPRLQLRRHPYITQRGKGKNAQQFIANMRSGAVAGFKYFRFSDTKAVDLTLCGKGEGLVQISITPDFSEICGEALVRVQKNRRRIPVPCQIPEGVHPLYVRFLGRGYVHFWRFNIRK